MGKRGRPLPDQIFLLTGASEGIGRATARLLAERGASGVLAARSADALDALVVELESFPGTRWAVPCDLSDPVQRERLVSEALHRFGRVDVLINNAGVGLDASVEESTLEEARYLFEVNFFAPLHLSLLLLPQMRQQQSGQIVQVSSIVGRRATPHLGLYAATKYALNGLSDALRSELQGSPIQVTSIYPGVTATRFVPNQLRTARTNARARIAVPPARVAAVILDSIERRSRARYVTGADRVLVALATLLPALAEWALAWLFRRRRG